MVDNVNCVVDNTDQDKEEQCSSGVSKWQSMVDNVNLLGWQSRLVDKTIAVLTGSSSRCVKNAKGSGGVGGVCYANRGMTIEGTFLHSYTVCGIVGTCVQT